jgi:hypothetical protein
VVLWLWTSYSVVQYIDAEGHVHVVLMDALVSFLVGSPPKGVGVKSISWNERATEEVSAQGLDDPRQANCSTCGTQPQLRQFARYQCECGELEGFVTEG